MDTKIELVLLIALTPINNSGKPVAEGMPFTVEPDHVQQLLDAKAARVPSEDEVAQLTAASAPAPTTAPTPTPTAAPAPTPTAAPAPAPTEAPAPAPAKARSGKSTS